MPSVSPEQTQDDVGNRVLTPGTVFFDELVSKLDAVSSLRLLRNLPLEGPLDYAVMKMHLAVQAAFADVIEHRRPEKQYVQAARLHFHQYLCLSRSVIGKRVPAWVWGAATKLNEARNSLAHELEPGGFEQHVTDFVRIVAKNDPRIDQVKDAVLATCFSAMVLYIHLVSALAPERESAALADALGQFIERSGGTLGGAARVTKP